MAKDSRALEYLVGTVQAGVESPSTFCHLPLTQNHDSFYPDEGEKTYYSMGSSSTTP